MTRYIELPLFAFVSARNNLGGSVGGTLVSNVIGRHSDGLNDNVTELIKVEVNKAFDYNEAKDLAEMQMVIWDAMYTRYKESSEKDKEKKKRLKAHMKYWEKTYDWYDKRLYKNGFGSDDEWSPRKKAKFIFDGVHAFILALYFVIKDRQFLVDHKPDEHESEYWRSQINFAKAAIDELRKRIGELAKLKSEFPDGDMKGPPFDDEDTIMPLLSPREENCDQVKGRKRLFRKNHW